MTFYRLARRRQGRAACAALLLAGVIGSVSAAEAPLPTQPQP